VLPESQEVFPPCRRSLVQSVIPAPVLHLALCNIAIFGFIRFQIMHNKSSMEIRKAGDQVYQARNDENSSKIVNKVH
jgi:hypothetical protein